MEQIKIDVVKQWLINRKEFSTLEVIEELEKENEMLKSDLNVARKDRENLQIAVGKGLQEYIKDCPYSALEYYATSKVVEENVTLKVQIKKMRNCGNCNGIINGVRQEKCHLCMRSKLLSEWESAE